MPARIHVDDLQLLGDRFKEARERLGLRRVELVREAGYKNTNKGCRRIRHIERGEPPLADERVLRRFVHVLELDLETLWREVRQRHMARLEAEREGHELWLGGLLRKAREEAGLKVCVVLQDKRSVFIERDGYHFESWEPPSMSIGGRDIGVLPPLPLTFVEADEQE